jgi:hypothetical protein
LRPQIQTIAELLQVSEVFLPDGLRAEIKCIAQEIMYLGKGRRSFYSLDKEVNFVQVTAT